MEPWQKVLREITLSFKNEDAYEEALEIGYKLSNDGYKVYERAGNTLLIPAILRKEFKCFLNEKLASVHDVPLSETKRRARRAEVALHFVCDDSYDKASDVANDLENDGYEIDFPGQGAIIIQRALVPKFKEFKKKNLYVERRVMAAGELIRQEELNELRKKHRGF